MRDLARDLWQSPGNLTYHFAKKEDIVLEIARRLNYANSHTIEVERRPVDLGQFMETFYAVFRDQYNFRCLVLNVIHIMQHYPSVAHHYAQS